MEVALVICLLMGSGVLPSQVSSIAEGDVITRRFDDATSPWPAQLQMNGDKNRDPDLLRFASQEEYENEGNHKLNLQYFAQSQGEKITGKTRDRDQMRESDQMNGDSDEPGPPNKKTRFEANSKPNFKAMGADLTNENEDHITLPSDKPCPVNTQQCEIPHSKTNGEVCVIERKRSTPDFYSDIVSSKQQIDINNLEVHTLPVGQGDCTVIYCPKGEKAVLFDCGSLTSGDNQFSEDDVRSYFAKVREITIIVSHGDKDHYSYLPTVFHHEKQKKIFDKISKVIIGGPQSDLSCERTGIKDWLKKLKSIIQTGPGHASVDDLNEMDNFCGNDSDFKFEFIAAGHESARKKPKNQKSIVMKLSRKGNDSSSPSLLFCGDMEGDFAKTLATDSVTKAKLQSTHYKVAHHGASSLANKDEWLEAINPEEAHVSQAYYGPFGHPRCDAIDLLFKKLGTTSTIGSLTHSFTCFHAKPERKSGKLAYIPKHIRTMKICHRLYSTAPTNNAICTIVLSFEPAGPAKTTYTCMEKKGGEIEVLDFGCPPSDGDDDDDDNVTGGG